MNMITRQAQFTDIEAVHTIEQQAIGSWTYNQFVEELAKEFSILLVSAEGSVVTGYISAWIIGDQAEIHSIAVSENYARTGTGKKLLCSLEMYAVERGCGSILLEVRSRNTRAVNFYRKNGFTETGRRKNYYQDDDALLMEKILS